MKQKILSMLTLQDAMNSRINPDWRQAGNAWYRAVWIECAEMLDHYGWKWWKHQEPDMQQVVLEIVDIWHFILSDLLQNSDSIEQLASDIAVQLGQQPENRQLPQAVEHMALQTLKTRSADIAAFNSLLTSANLSLDALYRGYIGKNVLNFFRQDHGYREGSYQKSWNGREDNEYLVELVDRLDADRDDFQQQLYDGLKNLYQQHVESAGA